MRRTSYGLMLFFLTACQKNNLPENEGHIEQSAQVTDSVTASFELTEKQFISLFNSKSDDGHRGLHIDKLETGKSTAGGHQFRYRFPHDIELTGEVGDQSHRIFKLRSALAAGTHTDNPALLVKADIDKIIIGITNPNLDYREVDDLYAALLSKVDEWSYPDIKRNGVLYYNERTSTHTYFTASLD